MSIALSNVNQSTDPNMEFQLANTDQRIIKYIKNLEMIYFEGFISVKDSLFVPNMVFLIFGQKLLRYQRIDRLLTIMWLFVYLYRKRLNNGPPFFGICMHILCLCMLYMHEKGWSIIQAFTV